MRRCAVREPPASPTSSFVASAALLVIPEAGNAQFSLERRKEATRGGMKTSTRGTTVSIPERGRATRRMERRPRANVGAGVVRCGAPPAAPQASTLVSARRASRNLSQDLARMPESPRGDLLLARLDQRSPHARGVGKRSAEGREYTLPRDAGGDDDRTPARGGDGGARHPRAGLRQAPGSLPWEAQRGIARQARRGHRPSVQGACGGVPHSRLAIDRAYRAFRVRSRRARSGRGVRGGAGARHAVRFAPGVNCAFTNLRRRSLPTLLLPSHRSRCPPPSFPLISFRVGLSRNPSRGTRALTSTTT